MASELDFLNSNFEINSKKKKMKTNPAVWFEIYVEDMNRAKKFYETVLDVELQKLPMPDTLDSDMVMMAFPSEMTAAGASGTLVKMSGFKPGAGGSLIYFGSEDCSVEEKRIEKAGGKIHQSKQSLGEHGFMVLAGDTEGNMFGIHSMA